MENKENFKKNGHKNVTEMQITGSAGIPLKHPK